MEIRVLEELKLNVEYIKQNITPFDGIRVLEEFQLQVVYIVNIIPLDGNQSTWGIKYKIQLY